MRTAIERGWEDRVVRVSKARLLETLQKNRDKHRQDYLASLDGYVAMAREKLKRKFESARSDLTLTFDQLSEQIGRFDKSNPEHVCKLTETITLIQAVSFSLKVPQDHTYDYDVAIQMAEWSEDEVIEITQSQLQCFIMDDWDWKRDFMHLNRMYTSQG